MIAQDYDLSNLAENRPTWIIGPGTVPHVLEAQEEGTIFEAQMIVCKHLEDSEIFQLKDLETATWFLQMIESHIRTGGNWRALMHDHSKSEKATHH